MLKPDIPENNSWLSQTITFDLIAGPYPLQTTCDSSETWFRRTTDCALSQLIE